jgi:hypothetical protein
MPNELRYDAGTSQSAVVTYTVSLTEQKAIKASAIKGRFQTVMLGGYQHNFGGSAGIRTLDMRDADDKANWTLLLIKCQGLIAQGLGANAVTIRGQNNETFTVSANTAFAGLQAMLAWGEAAFSRKWALEAQIAASSDPESIDIEADWP